MLEGRGVTKRFGGLVAVDRVDFYVPKGKIVSVIGPNGAGKTTLFNGITGVFPIDEGSLLFGEEKREIRHVRPHEAAELGIARTFQTIRLFKNMTVLENVMLGRHAVSSAGVWESVWRFHQVRQEERHIREKSADLLDWVGLAGKMSECARNLPYGHQRKLEIARALATDPKLLLLDEPAAGMNPNEKKELLELIARIRATGVTILLIEHDMKVVMPISDLVYVLDYGVKIAEGKPEAIQNNPKVIEAYLGKK